REFMGEINFERRDQLLAIAHDASNKIVEEWKDINPNKEIAVLLFGSVAKGLVKRPEHKDPSNIDLAVIGDFSPEESEALFDAIRPYRADVQDMILQDCDEIESEDHNPGNLGVLVQNTEKMSNGHFSGAINHISAGAFALYDPSNMWNAIEEHTLTEMAKEQKTKRKKRHRAVIPEWRSFEKRLRNAEARVNERPQLNQSGVIYQQLELSVT
ncbi:MAG TPA: nucleotidyltransferase domain-containing protein, partial [Patescibacteria group bacterium]|nr:nucleotidyltransferase domain-containing protein [Patescibacteria group bacterium]